MAQQPYISKSAFSVPPDARGGSYLGEPLIRPSRGVSAPSDEPLPPPEWWSVDDPRCGTAVGGTLYDPGVLQEWWLNLAGDDDPFVIQLTADDRIAGKHIARITSCWVSVKPGRESFSPTGLRRLASVAAAAADLLT